MTEASTPGAARRAYAETFRSLAGLRSESIVRAFAAVRNVNASCLCGGVRIEISGKLGPLVYCHCSRCQKAQGTAFGANADVRGRYWRYGSGEELVHEFESSPGVFRAFCSRCGSPLYSRRVSAPDVRRIRLGILDEDPGRRALAHFHVASKAPWFEIADTLPQFAGGPEDHVEEVAAKLGG